MCVPLEPLQPYMREGHLAPIELRVRAANKFGYPMNVLENMLEHHHRVTSEQYQKEQADFIKEVFGVAKPSSSKPVKTHEVTRAKRTCNKRRYVDFYNLTSLLDYYDETKVIEKVRE
jgi:hypothetical protein